MPSPTTKARRRCGFNIPPHHLNPILEISEEVVTFADYSFKFPLPPISTPAAPRSPGVSPLHSASLPLTPTSSDDEFSVPLRYSKKGATIKSLVITKLPRSEARRFPIIDRSDDDEQESDSEWYSREFSKIIDTTPSPTYFPAAHRDSFSVAPPAYHDSISCHPFACRPLPRISIPDDVCSPVPTSLEVDRCPFLSLSLPVSPFFDQEQHQLDEDDNLSFAFVFEDAEDHQRDEKSIQLVTPKRMSSLLPVCTPSPPSPPPSSSPSPLPSLPRTPRPRPLPPLPTSVPLVPLRPRRCSTMTSISSLSFPPSPVLSPESLPTDEFVDDSDGDDERRYGLKSRWSSSTLGEEREHDSSILNASKKLKTYFRGTKRTSSPSSSPSPSPSPATKISIPSPIKFRAKGQKNKKKKAERSRGHGRKGGGLNEEGLVIRPQDSFLPRVEEEETRFRTGLRRSFEVAPVPLSGGGRGLRRKPIPEEMLVRAG